MSLFQWGDFTLHSGSKSWWRIDCDALSDSEIELFAKMISERIGEFTAVVCPPSHPGSAAPKLVNALTKYLYPNKSNPGFTRILIVDDVLTTGRSMEEVRERFESQMPGSTVGAVIFARGSHHSWIKPLFQYIP